MSDVITPGASLRDSLLLSTAVGAIPAAVTWLVIGDWPFEIGNAGSVLVLGAAAAAVYKGIFDEITIPIGSEGVATWQGHPIHKIYSPGTHRVLKGFQGAIPVDLKGRDLKPQQFEQLVRDTVPITIDAYCVAKIVNSYIYLTAVSHPEELLTDLLESEIRLFASQWLRASGLISQKDLLGEFLQLPKLGDSNHSKYIPFRSKLEKLKTGENQSIDSDGIDNIMENAGNFSAAAADWGFKISQIHVTDVDLPQRLKDAAAARAAEPDVNADTLLKQQVRMQLVDQMTARGLSPDRAMTEANLIMNLGDVSRIAHDFTIYDPDKAIEHLGPEAAAVFARAVRDTSSTK
jgi:regulator of protease activity HflC (stomatin/prohibitin superfamily)